MSDPDIRSNWHLARGTGDARFVLDCAVTAEFVEPTRDEVRNTLMQILDEALGPDETTADEIAGWDPSKPLMVPLTELEHLRQWKAEAIPLLDILERCHEAIPPPHQARLGESKADAVLAYIIYSDND